MTKEQINLASTFWSQSYEHRRIDKWVAPFLELETNRGWVKHIRKARYFTESEAAEKMGISKSGYQQLEQREFLGTISLNNLRKVAKVLDCELIYAIRPIDQQKFSAALWEKLVLISIDHHWVKTRPEYLKARALACITKMMMEKPKFRKTLTRPWRKEPF